MVLLRPSAPFFFFVMMIVFVPIALCSSCCFKVSPIIFKKRKRKNKSEKLLH